jgi:osmotically-inducible protein OsmY
MNLNLGHSSVVFVCTAIAGIIITGCTDEARTDYSDAGSKTAIAAKDTGKAIVADATAAAHSVAGEIDNASRANNQTSAKVKRAILDATDIETTELSVDTNGSKVTLHGSVVTEVQNQRAEQLARSVVGPNYTVDDKLAVSSQK